VRGGRLTRETLARIERWVAREGVECLYFLADASDPETAPLAEDAGFRLVDVRVTLARRLGGPGGGAPDAAAGGGPAPRIAGPPPRIAGPARPEPAIAVAVRHAAAADLPELRRIAAASHRESRFYYDRHFDHGRCDALYAAWIEQSCRDPDGVVLVAAAARQPAAPCGYITVTLAAGGEGRIGLFAVAGAAQGQGVGGRLIAAALDWLEGRGAGAVSVVTQGRNVRAQRIYQQYGMRTRSLELWYHRWR
jgi:dTDP-4-amino-4,6-dideoxy-D-galactose acyltransferase